MNTLAIPLNDRIAYKIDHLLRLAGERHDQGETNFDGKEYRRVERKWLRYREAWQMLKFIYDANCEELIKTFCAPEEQTELIEIAKKIGFISVDEPPMKPYTLIIDANAGTSGMQL